MAKVSVIMPVYNGAKYIGEAIGSVFAQTYKDWELIVVDDGSTDDTESVVANLSLPLKFLRQQNLGPSAARNLGLRSATGKYIAFLDADDTWDQNFLSMTVCQLDGLDKSVVGICSGWVYTDEYGTELPHTRVSRDGYLGLQDFLITNPFPIHAILARSNLLLSVNGFDDQIHAMEDWDLWLRLIAMGGQFYAVQSCLAKYRLHGLTNSRQPDRMRAGRLRALEKLFARNDLPVDIQVRKPCVFGRAHIQSSVELYAVERNSEALSEFCEAAQMCPRLLVDDEILYAVVCAQQLVGYKGTGEFLNLASGEQRLLDAIQVGLKAAGHSEKSSRRVYGKVYLTLGHLAYNQHRMRITRRYIYLALKHDISCLNGDTLQLLAKSLFGSKLLVVFRDLKEHKFV
jgi:glycosyltransferase involved in cell wall biosynthesis